MFTEEQMKRLQRKDLNEMKRKLNKKIKKIKKERIKKEGKIENRIFIPKYIEVNQRQSKPAFI